MDLENAVVNLTPDIVKIYLYAKDPYKKYQLLINKREITGLFK